MKIGIISDTHGDLETWLHVLATCFSDADLIIHAGDVLYGADTTTARLFNESLRTLKIPLLAVQGNCDRFSGSTRPQIPLLTPYGKVSVNRHTILFMHGDTYSTPLSKQLCAEEQNADIVVSGHTHEYCFYNSNGLILLNPGSPSRPRDRERTPTVMVLHDEKVDLVDIRNNYVMESYILKQPANPGPMAGRTI